MIKKIMVFQQEIKKKGINDTRIEVQASGTHLP